MVLFCVGVVLATGPLLFSQPGNGPFPVGGGGGGTTNSPAGFAPTNQVNRTGAPSGTGPIFTWPDFLANTISNTNLVPAGAVYDNGVAQGFPVYTINAPVGTVFLSVVPAGLSDQGAINTDFSGGVITGLFTNNSTSFFLWTQGSASTPVKSLLYAVNTNAFATTYIGGDFIGTIDSSVIVPDANLTANVQLKNQALSEFAGNGGPPHTLTSSNTTGGSTLTLNSIGTTGYADVNLQIGGVLKAAIGIGGSGTGIYTNTYFEMYAGLDWYFINSANIYGGVKGGNGDFVWYRDGSTNTPMIEISRANNMITNTSPVTFLAPPTIATTNAQPAGITITAGTVVASTNKIIWVTITNAGLSYSFQAFKN